MPSSRGSLRSPCAEFFFAPQHGGVCSQPQNLLLAVAGLRGPTFRLSSSLRKHSPSFSLIWKERPTPLAPRKSHFPGVLSSELFLPLELPVSSTLASGFSHSSFRFLPLAPVYSHFCCRLGCFFRPRTFHLVSQLESCVAGRTMRPYAVSERALCKADITTSLDLSRQK